MGQDILNRNSINNPLNVYEFFYKKNVPLQELIIDSHFQTNKDIIELCKIFKDESFKSARRIDNEDRIGHLNLHQYIYFIYYVIVVHDNFNQTSDQLFKAKNYNFLDVNNKEYYNIEYDDYSVNMNVVYQNSNHSCLNEGMIYCIDQDDFYLPIIDQDILYHNRIEDIVYYTKDIENLIMYMLYEVESKLIELIMIDCQNNDITIQHSYNNKKWLIVYTLANLRQDIMAVFSVKFHENKIFFYCFKDYIIKLFDCFFIDVTGVDPEKLSREFVHYCCGKPIEGQNPFEYFKIILDKKYSRLSQKDKRKYIIDIFYFLYLRKWFILDRKFKNGKNNELEKKSVFSKTLSELLEFEGNRGFKETKIRNHFHILNECQMNDKDFEIPNFKNVNNFIKNISNNIKSAKIV